MLQLTRTSDPPSCHSLYHNGKQRLTVSHRTYTRKHARTHTHTLRHITHAHARTDMHTHPHTHSHILVPLVYIAHKSQQNLPCPFRKHPSRRQVQNAILFCKHFTAFQLFECCPSGGLHCKEHVVQSFDIQAFYQKRVELAETCNHAGLELALNGT